MSKKLYKFNLLSCNPPEDYRWVRKGEAYLHNDVWWITYGGFRSKVRLDEEDICIEDYPLKSMLRMHEYKGFVRKL